LRNELEAIQTTEGGQDKSERHALRVPPKKDRQINTLVPLRLQEAQSSLKQELGHTALRTPKEEAQKEQHKPLRNGRKYSPLRGLMRQTLNQ
jgi:hypothetical protein